MILYGTEIEVGDYFQSHIVQGRVTSIEHDELGFPAFLVLKLDDGHLARVDVSLVKFSAVH